MTILNKPTIYNNPTIYNMGGSVPSGVKIGERYYETTEINGITILTENLDYFFDGLEVNTSGSIPNTYAAWYYDCSYTTWGYNGRKCGMLYNWFAVKKLNDERNIHFPGWHIITNAEITSLKNYGDPGMGKKLKSVSKPWCSSWNGDDIYGAKFLPCGRCGAGTFAYAGTEAWMWTSTEYDYSNAYYYKLDNGNDITTGFNDSKQLLACAIRLVKD